MSKETRRLNDESKQRWWNTLFRTAAVVAAGDAITEEDKLLAQAQVLEDEAVALRAKAAAIRAASQKPGG